MRREQVNNFYIVLGAELFCRVARRYRDSDRNARRSENEMPR